MEARGRLYFTIVKEEKHFPVAYEGDFLGIIRMDSIDSNNRSVRVGLDIDPNQRGQGFGSLAFKALLSFCFDHWNQHRVWLCVLEDNKIAKKMYDNLGFKEEGRYRESIFRNGKYVDYIVMSILESEYHK